MFKCINTYCAKKIRVWKGMFSFLEIRTLRTRKITSGEKKEI